MKVLEDKMANKERRVVLVGTYRGDQLTKWRGWYNYPISDDDKITETDAALITELWLFKGTKEQRNYKAEFVGIKTREELIRDYGYPCVATTPPSSGGRVSSRAVKLNALLPSDAA